MLPPSASVLPSSSMSFSANRFVKPLKIAAETIISAVSQMFNVSLNIIFADITIVQDSPIGGTVAIISGERKQITKAIEYLIEKNVGVEVIKDARADR